MIQLIIGRRGSGKTKKLIDMIGEAQKVSKGNIVCIEKGQILTYDLSHKVRLIDTNLYNIKGFDSLYGFISGIMAGNYDITDIFIDSFFKIVPREYDVFAEFIEKVENMSKENGDINIVFTISADRDELPDMVDRYLIK